MKTKILKKIFLFLAISLIYVISFSGFKEVSEIKISSTPHLVNINDFFMYLLSTGYQDTYTPDPYRTFWNMDNHIPYYDELNFNAAHMYSSNTDSLGHFDSTLNNGQIQRMDNLIYNVAENGMQRVFDRNKISKLCFSQRLVYEVSNGGNTTENYGFCYQDCNGTYTTDDNRTVLYKSTQPTTDATPGWLCKDIYENMQHSDLHHFAGNDYVNWHVKPVMKIRTQDFDAQSTTPVVRIDIIKFNGTLLKSIDIKVRNFKDLSGNYDGSYIFNYNFTDELPGTNLTASGTTDANGLNYGSLYPNAESSQVDFRVYWYGNVDVWFDKMIVDDEIANDLFNEDFDPRIQEEAVNFGDEVLFSVDELVSSSAYTTKYVIDKAKEYNSNSKIIFAISNNLNEYSHRNDNTGSKMLLDIARPDIVAIDAHPLPIDINYFDGFVPQSLSTNNTELDSRIPSEWITTNGTYNNELQIKALGNKVDEVIGYQGTFLYQIYKVRNEIAQLSGGYNPKVVIQPQIQGWILENMSNGEFMNSAQKEPTNEEIQAQAGIALAHGADGISWFFYGSFETEGHNTLLFDNPPEPTSAPNMFRVFGMRNRYGDPQYGSHTPRTKNIYGQNKWDYVKNMNAKIMNWKSALDKTKWDGGYSVHYEGANHKFISDITSIDPNGSGVSACAEDFITYDCPEERYWEMGFYVNDPLSPNYNANDKSKYFIMVNRRCVPDAPSGAGDHRQLKIKFNPSALSYAINWKIIDVNTGNTIVTINKNSNAYYNFGQFLPGEGKLYKIEPIIHSREGGTLVADEIIEGSVTIGGPIISDGYNITIEPNATLNFIDSGKITIINSKFICGEVRGDHGTDVTFTSTNRWNGITFSNCPRVEISSTKFEKVDSTIGDQNFALKFIDCDTMKIRYCNFVTESGMKNGAISINYLPQLETPIFPLIDILGNTFDCNGVSNPSVQVMNYGDIQNPVLIRWNNFDGNNSPVGLMLNNVTAGVIRDNSFNNYLLSINAIATYIDVYGNNIQNEINSNNCGLNIASGSMANLNTALYGYYIGGLNSFMNYEPGSTNIYTDNSTFDINSGGNIFDVSGSGFHFDGVMSLDYYNSPVTAEQNCFNVSGSQDGINHDVIWFLYTTPVDFDVEPMGCGVYPGDFEIISYGDIQDTLWNKFGGWGGGMSNKKSKSSISTLSNKSDSLKISLRKQNLEEVKRIGNDILDTYEDSIKTIDVIQPLYYATMQIDDLNHTGILSFKTKLENLISNNSENEALVLRCNYFIQKCKVNLGDYSSALSGFYDIMQNYPYDWEGVVAGWDYSATQLISQGGSGGGENNSQNAEQAELSLPNDDPKKIKSTINKTLSDTKENAIKQIKVEEQKVKELKIDVKNEKNIKQSKALEKKLQQKKVMSEVIKPRKPKTVIEHINFVNADIQKIYSVNNKTTNIGDNTLIPESYKLEQNYPNPFNPITKIKFELPKESKVTIEIYDILGRKVAHLINNELRQAGRYEVQFNGQNFASGIYFYRLVASDFIQTKRMMLIK